MTNEAEKRSRYVRANPQPVPAGQDEVAQALAELRKLAPTAACSIAHVRRSGFGTPSLGEDDPIKVYEGQWVVWVNLMPRGEAETLTEAMAKVRQWYDMLPTADVAQNVREWKKEQDA